MGEFVVVEWPDSQFLMEKDGFVNHCHLIDTEPLVEEYGSSAYFVDKYWLEEVVEDMKDPKTLKIPNTYFGLPDKEYDNIYRKLQRSTKGFDDTELWNFYVTISKFIASRMPTFIKMCDKVKCTPCAFESYDEWRLVLEKINFAFASISEMDEIDWSEAKNVAVHEGVELFAKYFFNLWD